MNPAMSTSAAVVVEVQAERQYTAIASSGALTDERRSGFVGTKQRFLTAEHDLA
jgi:hypothetical protein